MPSNTHAESCTSAALAPEPPTYQDQAELQAHPEPPPETSAAPDRATPERATLRRRSSRLSSAWPPGIAPGGASASEERSSGGDEERVGDGKTPRTAKAQRRHLREGQKLLMLRLQREAVPALGIWGVPTMGASSHKGSWLWLGGQVFEHNMTHLPSLHTYRGAQEVANMLKARTSAKGFGHAFYRTT